MPSAATPPAWAEAILYLLVPPGRAESISGDLLEQYRDEKHPRLGSLRADVWYVRQVAGLFMRTYAALALLPIVFFVGSDLLNTFRDPAGNRYLEIGWLIGAAFATAFALSGFLGGWVSRRVRGGLAVAIGTFLVFWSFVAAWWTATFYPFARF